MRHAGLHGLDAIRKQSAHGIGHQRSKTIGHPPLANLDQELVNAEAHPDGSDVATRAIWWAIVLRRCPNREEIRQAGHRPNDGGAMHFGLGNSLGTWWATSCDGWAIELRRLGDRWATIHENAIRYIYNIIYSLNFIYSLSDPYASEASSTFLKIMFSISYSTLNFPVARPPISSSSI